MWLEVPLPHTDYYVTWSSAVQLPHMEYSLAWSSASAQGIYWDLKFRSSASAYRIVWLGTLKWQQFRFLTRKILAWKLRSPLPYNKFSTTWSFAVLFPYKSFDFKSRSSASAQRIFCDLKFRIFSSAQGIYYVSKFSRSAFAHRTICDLTFRSFAQYTVTWISAVPLPQEKTSFEIPHFCFYTRTLLFFGKSTLIQPPTLFLIFVLSYMNDGSSEGQRNKRIGMLLAKVVVNVWLREHKLMTHYVYIGIVRDRAARQASRYDRENEAGLLCLHTYVNAFGRRQYLPDVMDYLPIRSITVCGKSNYLISVDRP